MVLLLILIPICQKKLSNRGAQPVSNLNEMLHDLVQVNALITDFDNEMVYWG